MDLEHGKPNAKRKRVPVNGCGTEMENGEGEKTEDAGEALPKRILRSASKNLSFAPPAVEIKKPKGKAVSTSRKPNATGTDSKDSCVEKRTTEIAKPSISKSKEFSEFKNTKKGEKTAALSNPSIQIVTGTNGILSSKDNTPAGKEFTFQEDLPKIEDNFSSMDTLTDESMQWRKNPMLIDPIIRCIFGFLDIKDVKNFRFVSREWDSAGMQLLGSRALIHFQKGRINGPDRSPIDFSSCFLNLAPRFSSFGFSGSWTIEELSKFFVEQQKSIKELTFSGGKLIKNKTIVKHFDISPWISKSPILKSDVKYLTKLSIYSTECAIPLHLLKHIKNLSLADCRINLEAGIQIHPVKLFLCDIDFYQDETLDSIHINDIVNFSSAKEIDLNGSCHDTGEAEITIDLSGNFSLDSLTLHNIDIVNWETSKWNIGYLCLDYAELSATQMTINELYLCPDCDSSCDIFALPRSIEKLAIRKDVNITFSEPTTLENLKYLCVEVEVFMENDFCYLAHFRNCLQLTHLKFHAFRQFRGNISKIKLPVIPKAVKTLTLDYCLTDWIYGVENVEKIVFFNVEVEINFEKISKAKISVDDIIMICDEAEKRTNVQFVANFFKYQKCFNFCKRFYIGNLKWGARQLKDSILNEQVDTKSAFYVFENGEKGRALDEKSFYQLADIPKHIPKDD